MEIIVNGTTVMLRDSYPTREYDDMRQQFSLMDEKTPWHKKARLLGRFIESWEFKGEIDDIEVWGDFDLFSETLAIENAIGDLIKERSSWIDAAKNSESKSTTQ